MAQKLLTLYFDGSCWPNPAGTAAYGFALYEGPAKLDEGHGVIGTGPEFSNNYAEYISLYHGLLAVSTALNGERAHVSVKGDSQLVINTMLGRWRAKDGLYYPAYLDASNEVSKLQKQGVRFSFIWIPRENNTECDDLSKVHLSAESGIQDRMKKL
jgi:ribonuclease HI